MSVVVIGAGPAGLAVAAELGRRGIDAIVLERSDQLGASWRGHYDRLRLHTVRWLSHLPGYPIHRREGAWVTRDGVVRYLDEYAVHHRLDVRTGVAVTRIDSAPGGWSVETAGETFAATSVVVAAGYNHTSSVPEWVDESTFAGSITHASDYRNGRAFRGQHVLVVGSGNTGAEIAVDLSEHGAARVELAIRTPPHVMRRSVFGVPTQLAGLVIRRLPLGMADRLGRVVTRATAGPLERAGMRTPTLGMFSQAAKGRIPILDVGLIDAVLGERVLPVAHVVGIRGPIVELSDGSTSAPHAIVLATGYRRALEPIVGHLGLLDAEGVPLVRGAVCAASAPGVYFIGYTPPISGMLREIALDARRIARAVSARQQPTDVGRRRPPALTARVRAPR